MRRFVLPGADLQVGRHLALPADLVKHLRSVLRLGAGDAIQLLDGRGGLASARLLQLEPGAATAEILAVERAPAPELQLALIQGLPKGDKLDWVLQKGTELGIGEFILAPMARSVGKLKAERKGGKLERWQKIVAEAARQCGQPFLPQLQLAGGYAEALAARPADLKLLLWEEAARPLPELLPERPPQRIRVIVGPEGGLTAGEAKLARAAGYQAVRLGPRILRTETAGLAIMAILQYLYGDLSLGQPSHEMPLQGKDES